MPYEADDYLSRRFQTSDTDLAREVDKLAAPAVPGDNPNLVLYRKILFTVTRMVQADRNRRDIKVMLQTLHEMEHAFSVLGQFKQRCKVIVFGLVRTPVEHPVYALARKLDEELARYDLTAITGAGGGIMAAAHKGTGLENSPSFNTTLPFEQYANHTVDGSGDLLSFHLFFLRKLFFVKETDALVLRPGDLGTLDEALEVLTLVQTDKSPLALIVLLDQPGGRHWEHALESMQEQLLENHYILSAGMRLMRLVHSVEDTVKEIAQLYCNSHPSRWLKGMSVIRLNHVLNEATLAHLHRHLASLRLSGGFQQQAYSRQEQDEPEFRNPTYLAFVFNRRDQGRLRGLLDYINLPEN